LPLCGFALDCGGHSTFEGAALKRSGVLEVDMARIAVRYCAY
jgi:hypothetical protein